jgi:peptidoglycan L-alanyl-D-glutamate endopeptidase CwlK
MTDTLISHLAPELQGPCNAFLARYKDLGRKIEITETWRDPAREDALHAQGITKATGLTCKHCIMVDGKPAARAFDFALYDENGAYIADGTDDWYADAGQIAKDLGLKWGGDFTHPDFDHAELPD